MASVFLQKYVCPVMYTGGRSCRICMAGHIYELLRLRRRLRLTRIQPPSIAQHSEVDVRPFFLNVLYRFIQGVEKIIVIIIILLQLGNSKFLDMGKVFQFNDLHDEIRYAEQLEKYHGQERKRQYGELFRISTALLQQRKDMIQDIFRRGIQGENILPLKSLHIRNSAGFIADKIKPKLSGMRKVMAALPNDIEHVHDFRFH